MKTLETQIDIDAPASLVWQVLTDFAAYPQWNPFITEIIGTAYESSRLKVRIVPPGKSGMTFKPMVLKAIPNQELTWLGHLFVPGLFDGLHQFRIEDRETFTRFYQSETFTGLLVNLFGQKMFDATQQGFGAMNAALKERCTHIQGASA